MIAIPAANSKGPLTASFIDEEGDLPAGHQLEVMLSSMVRKSPAIAITAPAIINMFGNLRVSLRVDYDGKNLLLVRDFASATSSQTATDE